MNKTSLQLSNKREGYLKPLKNVSEAASSRQK